ncbi:phosphatidate cytidylyltransferase [Kineosphaera limosa NBRC 100340]|uniref:Phosphatidate cytidylyltransferase n=1 Tax=Kineosphaera limosa NBRC 100340 TaxID=1184609 RepID=K6X790_9MICO|nr:phosphatidate cytidylyltransferase [Kineosphaera limosa NBRC 100340]
MTSAATPSGPPAAGKSTGRAGRNLPMAIAVALLLGGLALAALTLVSWGWLLLATPAILLAVWELNEGMQAGRIHIPLVPVWLGAMAMLPAAYLGGPAALMVAFGLTILAVVCWRVASGLDGAARDIGGGAFIVAYAPFLAAFSALMLAAPDGNRRVIVFILVTIASDIGGYAAGVLAGKHPMAPSVSPKKSWEGFAGSAAACVVVGAIAVPTLLSGAWWAGALIGLVAVAMATLGDLVESMLKRDLGIKDLGRILPGHGGIMDRIDSLLLCAPGVWWMMLLLVPVA